jgi:hypothetical protein
VCTWKGRDLIKNQVQRFFKFEKNVIELGKKVQILEEPDSKLILGEPSHKFFKCQKWTKGSLKKDESRTTLVLTFVHTMKPARS